jgi:hypothetical protein
MNVPKKYLHDKLILLLVSISVFMTFLCSVLILLRAGIGQGVDSYIVSYRDNLGLGAYQRGSILPILGFILFVLIVLGINISLSIQTYPLRRTLSITILLLGILVLLLAIIVSNALLVLY